MSDRQGNIKDYQGNKIVPNTTSQAVLDAAKNQALSATLEATPDKDALGYPAFSTVTDYAVGDKVYYQNKLYKFKTAHSAGAWNASEVDEYNVKQALTEAEAATDEKLEAKANIDGSYDTLTAGMAKNIEGNGTSVGTYDVRPTGGAADVATGNAVIKGIRGNTVAWNQLCPTLASSYEEKGITVTTNGKFFSVHGTATKNFLNHIYINWGAGFIPQGHKVFFRLPPLSGADSGVHYTVRGGQDWAFGSTIEVFGTNNYLSFGMSVPANKSVNVSGYVDFFDLTQMFGEGNEPSTVEEFESWLANNIGLQPYYPYNEGELLPVKLNSFKTYGKNLLNPTTKKATLVAYEYSDNSNKYVIKGLPAGATLSFVPNATGEAVEVTPNADGEFTISGNGELTVSTDSSLDNTYLCMKWDGAYDDEMSAYKENSYPFDVTTMTGKLNGTGESVIIFPDGMKKAGSVYDEIRVENGVTKAIKRIVGVNMKNLDWYAYDRYYAVNVYDAKRYSKAADIAISNGYKSVLSLNADEQIAVNTYYYSANKIIVQDSKYETAAAFKEAMDGVMLYYVLETPLEYVIDGNPLPLTVLVDNYSIEKAVIAAPVDGAPKSAFATVETIYGMDAANWIDSANNGTFISADSMDNFLSALGAAMGGTWSKAWNGDHWAFTFTPTSNFLSTGVGASGTWGVDAETNNLKLTPAENSAE